MRTQQPARQIRARSRSRSRNRSRNRSRFASQLISGQSKEVIVVKTGSVLGITVSDNVNGLVYIRRIRPNTICAQMPDQIHVGDQIEKVNGESMIGKHMYVWVLEPRYKEYSCYRCKIRRRETSQCPPSKRASSGVLPWLKCIATPIGTLLRTPASERPST